MIEPSMSESDAAESVKEAHQRMVMNAQQAGRQIPGKAVDPDLVGMDNARMAVESSQRSMRNANRKSFIVPRLPWVKG